MYVCMVRILSQILKSIIELPGHSRKHRKHAKRNVDIYPPRIVLTATYKEALHVSRPNFCELEVNGIGGLEAFNMSLPRRDMCPLKVVRHRCVSLILLAEVRTNGSRAPINAIIRLGMCILW